MTTSLPLRRIQGNGYIIRRERCYDYPPLPCFMYTICDLRRNNLHLSVIFFSHTLILLDQMSGVDRILNP